jgi:xanthine/CO dehydrogenase XdhC/CoxF family maturation factor
LRPPVRLDTSLELLQTVDPVDRAGSVLATVVATAGSTYRKPGARMLIRCDGRYVGLLSGGCLESDLTEHAQKVRATGTAVAIEYDMRGPDDVLFGIGAGCEGAMRVLLEPAGPGSSADLALKAVVEATARGVSARLTVVHEATALRLGTYAVAPDHPALQAAETTATQEARSQSVDHRHDASPLRAFVEHVLPIPRLLICGAGPDAEPVVRAAVALHWRVVVVDHRPAYVIPEHFCGAETHLLEPGKLPELLAADHFHAAIVMSHHLPSDARYLEGLAANETPGYVGLLGPTARRERLYRDIGPEPTQRLRGRLHAPVGLDLGATTPEGIALAMVGQLHAWFAGRGGGAL